MKDQEINITLNIRCNVIPSDPATIKATVEDAFERQHERIREIATRGARRVIDKLAEAERDHGDCNCSACRSTDEAPAVERAQIFPDLAILAEIGYQAYSASTDNKNFRGEEMPTWADLPSGIKAAWTAAAAAIGKASI